MNKKEIRYYDSSMEVRKDGDSRTIEGHAVVFDSLSENLGGFREKIDPNALNDVLEDDVRALFNHDDNLILGRTKANTLGLTIDSKGLKYTIKAGSRSYEKDLMESISRGDVNQSSFGFIVEEDDWSEDKEGRVIRTIRKISRLFDVSPVTFPAYPDTSVAKRGLEDHQAKDVVGKDGAMGNENVMIGSTAGHSATGEAIFIGTSTNTANIPNEEINIVSDNAGATPALNIREKLTKLID